MADGQPKLWDGDQRIHGEVDGVNHADLQHRVTYEGITGDSIRTQNKLRDGRKMWIDMHPW